MGRTGSTGRTTLDAEEAAATLRRFMSKCGLSPARAARFLGVTETTINTWRNTPGCRPSGPALRLMAAALGEGTVADMLDDARRDP